MAAAHDPDSPEEGNPPARDGSSDALTDLEAARPGHAAGSQPGPGPDKNDDGKDAKKEGKDAKGEGKEGEDQKPPPTPEQRRKRTRMLIIGAVVLVVLIVAFAIYYVVYLQGRVDTDDAYVDGRAITFAAKVNGYVDKLAVNDNQLVHAGDLIISIDARDYEAALENAQGTLASDEAQLQQARLDREIKLTSTDSDLENAKAQRAVAQANLRKALRDLQRQKSVDPLATTQQQTDTASAQAATEEAQLREADAQLATASLVPQNIAIADAKVKQLEAQVEMAQAQVAQAQLNLGYTQVHAPQDGRITRRNVEQGSYVQAGQALLSLVSTEVWVTANYKENQLEKMRPGQPVAISVDAYPALDLHGHVDSIQMGSGSRFSAFPAENATGNFVKIVQRMPVKILIDRGLDPNQPLPLGASVVPTVDVR